jgi:G3E family GTPase
MELCGGSDPQHMIETIAAGEIGGRRMDEVAEIAGVMTAVDPVRLVPELSRGDLLADHALHTCANDERTVAESLAHQIEYASVLAVSGGHTPGELASARAM